MGRRGRAYAGVVELAEQRGEAAHVPRRGAALGAGRVGASARAARVCDARVRV